MNLKKLFPLAFLLIIEVILYFFSQNCFDWKIFIHASADILTHTDIYTKGYFGDFHYYYSTFFAVLLLPLSYLPLWISCFIWLNLNLLMVYRIWTLIKNYLPLERLNPLYTRLFAFGAFIFIFNVLHANFHQGQMTIFILFLVLEGLNQIDKKHIFYGSFLIALGIDIKILPIVFLPYLFYRKEWKSSGLVVFFLLILTFIPALLIGFEHNHHLLLSRWQIINPMNKEHILDVSQRPFMSITTLLSTLLVENAGDRDFEFKRNIANVSLPTLALIISLVRLFFIALVLRFIKAFPFQSTTNKLQLLYERSYILLITPLIFPHQNSYAFFLTFPASTWVIFYLLNKIQDRTNFKDKKQVLILVLFLLTYFCINCTFVFGQFNTFYNYVKVQTYGILLLFVFLFFCKPDNDFETSCKKIV